MSLKANDPRPPYLQVAADLREAITSGQLAPGERLPSGRTLAAKYGVALMTVQNALRALREEDLVFATPRGHFVHGGPDPEKPEAEDTHTPEYEAIMQQLDVVTDVVNRLADRVAELETLVRQENRSS